MASDLLIALSCGGSVHEVYTLQDRILAVLFLNGQHGLLPPVFPFQLRILLLTLGGIRVIKETELLRLFLLWNAASGDNSGGIQRDPSDE